MTKAFSNSYRDGSTALRGNCDDLPSNPSRTFIALEMADTCSCLLGDAGRFCCRSGAAQSEEDRRDMEWNQGSHSPILTGSENLAGSRGRPRISSCALMTMTKA